MLKKFFFRLLSSFLGAWLALVLFGVVAVIVAVGVFSRLSADGNQASVKSHSILKLTLNGMIEETEKSTDLDIASLMYGNIERPQTLSTLLRAIEEGGKNDDIEAMYIECGGVSAGGATLYSLRRAIAEFKKTGKKVYSYSDSYSQGDYYIASVADSIFLNPMGTVNLTGLSGTTMYLKGLFDKIGVKFNVVKVGSFKSAVEPFILNEMSEPARAQLDTLYDTMWSVLRTEMAKSRGINASALDKMVSDSFLFCQQGDVALRQKLVDKLVYKRSIDSHFASLLGQDKKDLNYVDATAFAGQPAYAEAYSSKNIVAVLYATGEIAETKDAGIYCEKMVPQIISLADDDNVKGLVLRVNSPGGSVFGSEQIAEALKYFKATGKPFAVSMGDVAASGGYWISADADRIYAEPLTITGSIGIYGLMPDAKGLAEKIGVNPQTVSTNPNAAMQNFIFGMNEQQLAAMQTMVDRGYDDFIKRVAKGRNMKESKVRTIAEGRVWAASTAMKIGLVDELGSLDDCVAWVAKQAKIQDNYDAASYPMYEQTFWDMIPTVGERTAALISSYKDMSPAAARYIFSVFARKPLQARMPEFRIRI